MRTEILLCVASLACSPALASAQVKAGVSLDADGVDSFYLAIGDHYRVPKSKVFLVRNKNISDAHLPVVFFLAREAHVPPDHIVSLRLGGRSWMEIAVAFGLGAEVFHVSVARPHGPPYGRALGHYKGKQRSEWHTIRLSDDDVVSLVGLKFLAARHGCSADAIIELHQKGDTLVKLARRAQEKHGLGPGHGKGVKVKVSPKSDVRKARPKKAGRGGSRGKGKGGA